MAVIITGALLFGVAVGLGIYHFGIRDPDAIAQAVRDISAAEGRAEELGERLTREERTVERLATQLERERETAEHLRERVRQIDQVAQYLRRENQRQRGIIEVLDSRIQADTSAITELGNLTEEGEEIVRHLLDEQVD